MRFEQWLETDEGVQRFGMELRPEYISVVRIAWDAAIKEAADLVADAYDEHSRISPDDIRGLSSIDYENHKTETKAR